MKIGIIGSGAAEAAEVGRRHFSGRAAARTNDPGTRQLLDEIFRMLLSTEPDPRLRETLSQWSPMSNDSDREV